VTWLVDTNVIGELTRRRPNPGVITWAGQATAIGLSVVTLEEIGYGLSSRPNPRVTAWFERFLAEQCRVFPVTSEIALRSGDLRGRFRARGQTRTQADMLIAATALSHRLTLVTRNEGDFEGCGITVLNPFS
jgi:predicted nucleic acid-binding protein